MEYIEDNFILRYTQVYHQWQYLSNIEFLLQNLFCVTDFVLLMPRLVVFFGCFL
jgi:hypothetical protein